MKLSKSPPELIERFDDASPEDPRVVRRLMFGYPALYLNGNMFAGTYANDVFVRLGDAGRAAAEDGGAGAFEPMPGRVMKDYVTLPSTVVEDRDRLAEWLTRARDHAAGLAPKEKRTKRRA